jgi:hypothetical protein
VSAVLAYPTGRTSTAAHQREGVWDIHTDQWAPVTGQESGSELPVRVRTRSGRLATVVFQARRRSVAIWHHGGVHGLLAGADLSHRLSYPWEPLTGFAVTLTCPGSDPWRAPTGLRVAVDGPLPTDTLIVISLRDVAQWPLTHTDVAGLRRLLNRSWE